VITSRRRTIRPVLSMHRIFATPCLCPHHGAYHSLLIVASGVLTRAPGGLTGALGSAPP
jgi:hypothetical protein